MHERFSPLFPIKLTTPKGFCNFMYEECANALRASIAVLEGDVQET